MGIWVLTIGCAAFLLTLTALAAAALCRIRTRLLFWAPMALWWLVVAGVWGTTAFAAWVLAYERFTYPNYFPQALFLAIAAGVGIPVLTVRARLRLFGRPDGENWPILPLLGVSAMILAADTVAFVELDGSAKSFARVARGQIDGEYLKLVGPDPAALDNAADLYRQAFTLCKQALEAADQEAQQAAAATTQATDGVPDEPPLPSEQIGRSEHANSPQVVALVGRLQPAVQLARLAAVKPACRMEKITEAPTFPRLLPSLSGFRQLACVLYSDALIAAHDGRTDDVVSDLIALRRLELHVQQSDRCLVTMLVGMGIGDLTNDAIAAVLPSMPAVPEHMAVLVRDDAAIKAELLAGLRGEELGATATLLDMAENKLDADLSGAVRVQPSVSPAPKGFGPSAGLYRVLYLATDLDGIRQHYDAALATVEGQQVETPWRDLEHARLSMLAKLLVPDISRVTQTRYPGWMATSHCASLCIVLSRYRADHGAYPATLDQLVPAYLASVPVDPFDQQPMRYHVEGDTAVVYSVGANRTDDGGRIHPPEGTSRQPEDIGLELRPAAKPQH